jgi:hypothetical protein
MKKAVSPRWAGYDHHLNEGGKAHSGVKGSLLTLLNTGHQHFNAQESAGALDLVD